MARLAAGCSVGCVIEIGSFHGKSAVALALGAREAAFRKSEIYCIEPHRNFVGVYGGVFGPKDRGSFYRTMLETGRFEDVALVGLTSAEVAPAWKLPVGLLFIDGDHRYEAVRSDFDLWKPHLSRNAVVVFDDAKDPAIGPARFVQELLEIGEFVKIEECGKLVALRQKPRTMDLLVACDHVVLSGGLLRFDRVAAAIAKDGHRLSFVTMGSEPAARRTGVAVLTLEEAQAKQWDCVMVPGAGFPPATIASFNVFRKPNFGQRVQHVLNDQTRREAFRAVNEALEPHVVIFNNEHWPVGSFTDFTADQFHFLFGAVDTARFRPSTARKPDGGRWFVGGLANKNPVPLIEAVGGMNDVVLMLFGMDNQILAQRYTHLIEEGGLKLAGVLDENGLPSFYQDLDCVVTTEIFAGWGNLAAEAMASGIPVICTRAGTMAFARDGETAIVIDEPTPEQLRSQMERLRADPSLGRLLAGNARRCIEAFDWQTYSGSLIDLCRHDGTKHYFHAPELGLYGKWPVEDRLEGLLPLIEQAPGSVVLDLGAAEGLIAKTFLDAGASLLHGFEIDASRVERARKLTADHGDKAVFAADDLSNWSRFVENQPRLRSSYDIVLFLGVHHHLPAATRNDTLRGAAQLARRFFAYRAPETVRVAEDVDAILDGLDFKVTCALEGRAGMGGSRIYERVSR
uniref:Class I SAM-dependent methyltransferase n=1 Tax=Bosea sp. NBC_00436 TaxID=2969620 RepID=A0A9E7ZLD0_9HYPH